MQAIIMAGGEGVRLRPMTLDKPKPLIPLLGEPVMGYALKLLARHAVRDITATLWYRPRLVRAAFGKGEAYGVRLRYQEETVQMGTAGSVRMAQKHIKDTFFVLSGDGLTDCDLTGALAYHKAKGALATLVVKRMPVPLAYGVVMADAGGRITRFIEKPSWRQAYSDLCNTGLYILDKRVLDCIPEGIPYDFGKQLFPALLTKGEPLYAYETRDYWCDVGDQRSYLTAQRDLMRKRVNLPLPGCQTLQGGAMCAPGARVDSAAELDDGCFICQGAQVEAGARLSLTCLFPYARAREKCELSGCVLCERATAGVAARLSEDTALGTGAGVGARAYLLPGVKVYPALRVSQDAVVAETVVSGDYGRPRFEEIALPQQGCTLMSALLRKYPAKVLLFMHEHGAEALYHILAGAALAQGADALLAGAGTRAMLSAVMDATGADMGIFVCKQSLTPLSAHGMPLSETALENIEQAALRGEGAPSFYAQGEARMFSGTREIYKTLLPDVPAACAALPVAIICEDSDVRELARRVLICKGVKALRVASEPVLAPHETGFLLSRDGARVLCCDETCTPPEEAQALLFARALLHAGAKELYEFPGLPAAADKLSPVRACDDSSECMRQTALARDGIARILLLLPLLCDCSLSTWAATLPGVRVKTRDIPCAPGDKSRVLGALIAGASKCALGDGVRITNPRGVASITPSQWRDSVRVCAEATSAEFADELCDLYSREVSKIIQGKL